MPRQKKMICHDCGTVFNRKPQNGDKQICWNCQSTKVTLVTDVKMPPSIPDAPDAKDFKMSKVAPPTGGGAITSEMLQKQRGLLKKVVQPKITLPGLQNSPIPRGVRTLAHLVKNPIVRADGIEFEMIWRARGAHSDRFAYLAKAQINLSAVLRNIASGHMNPEHSNFNSSYGNYSTNLPTRKGPRAAEIFEGISYFEYGWRTNVSPATKWSAYNNGVRSGYSVADNNDANAFLQNLRQGQVFCERLIVAETGEIFYTPDHYGTFFRYHPGAMQWYAYKSAGGASGPQWDESFYEESTGA